MMWGSTPGWMPGGGWFGGFGFLILIVLGVVVATAIWGARRRPGDHSADGRPRETPLEILQKRYARGEISKEEFEQIRRDLV